MNITLDPAEFSDVIQAAVDAAVRRLIAEQATILLDKILVDKPGAGDVLSVSVSTIDRWRREEGLPFVDGLRSRNWLPAGGEVASR